MRPFELGKPSVNSSIIAMPTVVALRPVSSDARVGEHRAVVWNCDSRTPRSAMRVIAGISTRPPKQSHVAIPVSSHTRYRMLGAPSGAVGAANGPQSGSESRISSSILPLNSVAIAGLTLVVDPRDSGCSLYPQGQWPMTRRRSPQNSVVSGALRSTRPLLGLFQDLDEPPTLRRRERASLHQRDAVADAGVAVLVVRLDLLGGPDDLAVQRVAPTVFQFDDDGFLHLVAHHEADAGLTLTAGLRGTRCLLGALDTARRIFRRGFWSRLGRLRRGLLRCGARAGFRFCHYESSPPGPEARPSSRSRSTV